jgi:hypothetical protein
MHLPSRIVVRTIGIIGERHPDLVLSTVSSRRSGGVVRTYKAMELVQDVGYSYDVIALVHIQSFDVDVFRIQFDILDCDQVNRSPCRLGQST